MSIQHSPQALTYYMSEPEPCDYVAGNSSRIIFISPDDDLDTHTFSELSQKGFCRSGTVVYKPNCLVCHQCLSCRVPVDDFQMNSIQKKAWKRNQDIHMQIISSAQATEQHFALYHRYIQARHSNSIMAEQLDYQQFDDFLVQSKGDSIFLEFYLQQHLIAVSVCDYVNDGLSAVYTFFDPDYQARSLGTFTVLKQIEYVKSLNLNYLYLGYWVPNSKKMQYKINYQPLEIYHHQQWYRLKSQLTTTELDELCELLKLATFQDNPLMTKI